MKLVVQSLITNSVSPDPEDSSRMLVATQRAVCRVVDELDDPIGDMTLVANYGELQNGSTYTITLDLLP